MITGAEGPQSLIQEKMIYMGPAPPLFVVGAN